MKLYTEEELLNKAATLCSSSEHCISEIAVKLQRYKLPVNAIQHITSRLLKEGFIDERRYAKAFVRDKYRFDKWGRVKIAQALRMKQIKDEDIASGLDEIDETTYREILKNLLDAKQKSIRAESDYERRGKLIRYAAGRGFEISEIESILGD
jgi:regulatory protein